MSHKKHSDEARQALEAIIGERLLGSRNFCATRHFYFGRTALQMEPAKSVFTVGLECPWRIRSPDGPIIVGSEDYYEKADVDEDPNWEPGSPAGHLQDQLLTNLLGTYRGGEIINTGSGLIVESIRTDDSGGFAIVLTGGMTLEAMPTSAHVMEWILIPPGGGSLVLMNGVLHRTRTDVNHQ